MNKIVRPVSLLNFDFLISLGLHLFVAGVIALFTLGKINFSKQVKKVNVEVFINPVQAPPELKINEQRPNKIDEVKPKVEKLVPTQKVFGINKNALTSEGTSQEGIEVKVGNTVAKENDNLKLDKEDEVALPIPTDEFLVTEMPKLVSEVRIPYPIEARKLGLEGAVVMDLLIDTAGVVREVSLVRGPGESLNEAAMKALKNFKFVPAKVKEQLVAVKIRYTYRFVLEGR